MMMPANYSAIAESEMTYVIGGGVLDILPNAWKAENVKTFNTNVVTIVGNSYVSDLIGKTLGVMFGGNWGGDGNGSSIFDADKGGLFSTVKYGVGHTSGKELNGFNKFMQVVGLSAAVYQLGTSTAKSKTGSAKVLLNDGTFKKY